MAEFITWMNGLPNLAVYVVLWAGAAAENVVPAIPADTFVALGGLLAGAGDLEARWVAIGTWLANVSGALVVYRLSHLHGPPFFDRGLGRYLLKPHQMERMAGFYERWGTLAIFFSRFIPGVRAVVPVFAGATHQPWSRVVLPLTVASAIWYFGLVQVGVVLGHNLDLLEAVLDGMNRWLALVGVVVASLIALWWYRTRHAPHD
jgi:membrane protein DedA with SNARE-associated domain